LGAVHFHSREKNWEKKGSVGGQLRRFLGKREGRFGWKGGMLNMPGILTKRGRGAIIKGRKSKLEKLKEEGEKQGGKKFCESRRKKA